jgi:hypothetical protein
MSLRTIAIAGWICFALDALFVLMLLVTKNMGDDAAGRGLATAWGMVATVPLLVAGGVLLWGTQRHSRAATIVGAALTALPFIVMLASTARGFAGKASRAVWRSRQGKFADPVLTAVARAVDKGDTATIRALLAKRDGTRDFSQRDAWGQTLLGYAVQRTQGMYAPEQSTEAARVLLQNGVPYTADAVREGENWFASIATSSTDKWNDLLEAALAAGADPNAREPYDENAMILSYNMTVAKLELLVRRGADVQARSARTDRPGWSTLMNAAYLGMWPEALFFLRHGVSPDYVARDGKTVRTVIAERLAERGEQGERADALGPAYAAFRAALDSAGVRAGR